MKSLVVENVLSYLKKQINRFFPTAKIAIAIIRSLIKQDDFKFLSSVIYIYYILDLCSEEKAYAECGFSKRKYYFRLSVLILINLVRFSLIVIANLARFSLIAIANLFWRKIKPVKQKMRLVLNVGLKPLKIRQLLNPALKLLIKGKVRLLSAAREEMTVFTDCNSLKIKKIIYLVLTKRVRYISGNFYVSLADNISIPWENLDCEEIKETSLLNFNLRFSSACLLKSCGYFEESLFILNEMIKGEKKEDRFWGLIGIADLKHLQLLWLKQNENLNHNIQGENLGNNVLFLKEEPTFQEIRSIFEEALALYPNNFFAHERLASFFMDFGLLKEAKIHLLESLTYSNFYLAQEKLRKLSVIENPELLGVKTSQEFVCDIVHDISRLSCQEIISYKEWSPPDSGQITFYECTKEGLYKRNITFQREPLWEATVKNAELIGPGFISLNRKYCLSQTHSLGEEHLSLFSEIEEIADGKALIKRCSFKDLEFYNDPVYPVSVWHSNYYHFLLEVIPSIMRFKNNTSLHENVKIMTPPLNKWQKDLISFFVGDFDNLIEADVNRYFFKKVYLLSNPSRYCVPSEDSIDLLRSKICSKKNMAPSKGKYVFLTRGKGLDRSLENSNQISDLLEHYGFIKLDPSTLSIMDQIDFFSNVDIIVAQGGAGLANLLFCPKETRVIIMACRQHYVLTFNFICSNLEQKSYVCYGDGHYRPNKYFLWSTSDFQIPVDLLEKVIRQAVNE